MYNHGALTDRALNEQLESHISHLVDFGPTLPDKGEKISRMIASLEEEKQRRASLASKTEKANEVEDVVLKEYYKGSFDALKEEVEASLPRKLLFAFPGDDKWDFKYRSMEMTTVEASPHPYDKRLVQKGEDLTPGAVSRYVKRPSFVPFHSARGCN